MQPPDSTLCATPHNYKSIAKTHLRAFFWSVRIHVPGKEWSGEKVVMRRRKALGRRSVSRAIRMPPLYRLLLLLLLLLALNLVSLYLSKNQFTIAHAAAVDAANDW